MDRLLDNTIKNALEGDFEAQKLVMKHYYSYIVSKLRNDTSVIGRQLAEDDGAIGTILDDLLLSLQKYEKR